MSRSAERHDELFSMISDMEEVICNLHRWGRVIRDLGTSNVDVDPQGLYVIGIALIDAAGCLKGDWAHCFDLARSLREGGR